MASQSSLRMVVDGWFDDEWQEFHGSETQGVGVDDEERSARGYDAWDERVLADLHRDQDDAQIMLRWNQPDDVLDELEQIEASDNREVWVEAMTEFRRRQLHRLLCEYFGTKDYARRELVLGWEPNPERPGKFRPTAKVLVGAWVEAKIGEKGSKLAGYASCAGTIRSKLTRREISKPVHGESSRRGWWVTYNGQ